MENSTDPHANIPTGVLRCDILLILVYLVCGIVGSIGNSLALVYFTKSQKQELSNNLYTIVAIIDLLVRHF